MINHIYNHIYNILEFKDFVLAQLYKLKTWSRIKSFMIFCV